MGKSTLPQGQKLAAVVDNIGVRSVLETNTEHVSMESARPVRAEISIEDAARLLFL